MLCFAVWVRREVHSGFCGLTRKQYIVDIGVEKRIVLKWILERWNKRVSTGFMWMRIGKLEGFCEHGNEYAGSMQFWEFRD